MQKVFQDPCISAVTSKRRSRHAKDCITNIQQLLEGETNRSLQSNKSDKGAINSLKALMNTINDLKLVQDGDTILLPQRIRLHLRHHDGNQAATCGQRGTGIRGNLHPGLNGEFFFFNCSSDVISFAGNLVSWQSTVCEQHTYRTLFSRTVVEQSSCH